MKFNFTVLCLGLACVLSTPKVEANEPAAKAASAPDAASSPAAGASAAAPTDKKHDKKADAKKVDEKKTDEKKKSDKKETADSNSKPLPSVIEKLVIEDLKAGSGKTAVKGKTIKVDYTGWLYDPKAPKGQGKQFDSSVGKEPFTFTLGAGMVIKGWDEGFKDMKVKGQRRLLIPADLGYGSRGAGNVIPPGATLMFEVELQDVMD